MREEKILIQLVQLLMQERGYEEKVPTEKEELKNLYKALVNTRMPYPISEKILKLEDEYLDLALKDKILTEGKTLKEIEHNMILWQGDITTLKCDIIVNAGNNQGLGCFNPRHLCIDNVIHTNAGMRLRLECQAILQGKEIDDGEIIVCDAYHLPCQKVITTVGPQINKEVTKEDEIKLASCYKNALEYAVRNHYHSIAFPSIATGLYGYPIEKAKFIAYHTVKEYTDQYEIKVIFDVFSKEDYDEYRKLFKSEKINREC